MKRPLTVFFTLVAAAVSAFPQQAPAGPISSVLVSITNKAGYPPEVEMRDRLQVTANKQLAKVVSAEPAFDMQVHVAVLIDKSGRPTQLVQREQEAATAFLNRFARPDTDKTFMMDLAQGQPNLTTFRDYTDVQAALSRRSNVAGDVVLEGLKSYVEEVEKRYGTKFPARRAVILFSNGGTQIGQDLLPKVREYAIRNRIALFVVNTDWTWRVLGTNSPSLMKELAEDTGGTFEEPPGGATQRAPVNDKQFPDILNHMGAVIRNQYELKYQMFKTESKIYPLDVRALDAGLVLHGPKYGVQEKR
jgi:hypothetical protein